MNYNQGDKMDAVGLAIEIKKSADEHNDTEDAMFLRDLTTILGPLNVQLTHVQFIIIALYLTLVGIAATIFNSIVIIVLIKRCPFQKRSVNVLLLNIAISDIAISFCGYPLFTASAYARGWLTGVAGCKLSGFMVYFFSCVTIVTYAYIAVYRYIYVCKPSLKPKLTRRFTCLLLAFNWVISFLWTGAPLIGWSRYILEPFGTSCSIDWSSGDIGNAFYLWLSCLFLYFVPLVAIFWSYWHVVKYSKGVNPHKTESPLGRRKNLFLKLRKEEVKIDMHVTKMCVLMTMVFLLVWTPYCVESIWAMYQTEISVLAAVMPTMCCKSSPLLNPLVLILSSSDFRDEIKKLFSWISVFRVRCHRNKQREGHRGVQTTDQQNHANSSTYYIRQCDGVGKKDDAAAMYYNKERVFIGHVKTQSIEVENAILRKDINERTKSQLSIDNEHHQEAKTSPKGKTHFKKMKKIRTKAVSPHIRKPVREDSNESRPSTS